MLRDIKDTEEEELKNWPKMKRFEKVEMIRKEKNFIETENKSKDSAWEGEKIKNLHELTNFPTQKKIIKRAQVRL